MYEARFYRDSKSESGRGSASVELAEEIIHTSTNHTNGERAKCAESNQKGDVMLGNQAAVWVRRELKPPTST